MKVIDYRTFEEDYFADVLERLTERVQAYGFTVSFSSDLPEESGADFDGQAIVFTDKMHPEALVFNLSHIVGHGIQWCVDSEHMVLARRVILPGEPLPDLELLAIKVYEQESSEYGLQILHDLGIRDLDQWVSDIWAWDWTHLADIYVRNRLAYPALHYDYSQIPFGQTLLRPKPIPAFTPRPVRDLLARVV